MAAHALVNIPTRAGGLRPSSQVAVVIFREKIAVYIRQFEDYRKTHPKWALALEAAGFAIISLAFSFLFKVL
jgi:hypothetical protein